MMTYEEALDEILRNVSPLEVQEMPLIRCVGQVVAKDIFSDYDLPLLDSSEPDGYAVRSEDVRGATSENPVVLRITGSVRAGQLPRRLLKPGTAIRTIAGCPIPQGADCVIPLEHTDEPASRGESGPKRRSYVRILRAEEPGTNIQRTGSTVSQGSLVVPCGTLVGPPQMSALAAIGKTTLEVIRRPIVAIVSTGDELIGLRSPLRRGKAYDCNTAAIASLVTQYGGIPRPLGIARDNEQSLMEKIQHGLTADVIVTSGGVSEGDRDLIRLVLGRMGRVVFSRISMEPGAPFAFGLVSHGAGESGAVSVPVFALAGPPIACLTNFETLVRPALLKMMGYRMPRDLGVDAVADDSVRGKKSTASVKWTHLESVRGTHRVIMNVSDSLGTLGAMATANSLTIIPCDTEVATGDRIQVLPLGWS